MMNLFEHILSKACSDNNFRNRLRANPKTALHEEFGLSFDEDHDIVVHQDTDTQTHLVVPPLDKLSDAERAEARTGAASLEFLKKTMYNPAPPIRPSTSKPASDTLTSLDPVSLAIAGRESISRGLNFLETSLEDNGAWHCIRFNVADPNIPRHYEHPPFVSAFCVLALQRSREPQARALCARTKRYLVDTMEYPGFWRYYQHLPQDLDSSTLCSLVLDSHPWIVLGRNVPRMLANRDTQGLFLTWLLAATEPDVVSPFRIEADPVVNANVIAYLGDIQETKQAQQWLKELIMDGTNLENSSKWYPDTVSFYYAIARAMKRVYFGSKDLNAKLADRILGLRDESGLFTNIFQAAQAVVALHNIGYIAGLNIKEQIENLLYSQQQDGSWPELLAFGDQSLRWGIVGQIGHGSESVTSAFCIDALECLIESLEF